MQIVIYLCPKAHYAPKAAAPRRELASCFRRSLLFSFADKSAASHAEKATEYNRTASISIRSLFKRLHSSRPPRCCPPNPSLAGFVRNTGKGREAKGSFRKYQ